MPKRLFTSAVVLVAVIFIAGCNTNIIQTFQTLAELTTQAEQEAFIQKAKEANSSQSNISMSGIAKIKIEGKQGELNFKHNKLNDDSSTEIFINDKHVYSIESGDSSYIGNGQIWLEMENSDTGSPVNIQDVFESKELFEKDYTYDGVRDCSNTKCHSFTFKDNDATSVMYFDGTDYLLKKSEVTTKDVVAVFDLTYGNASVYPTPTQTEKVEGLNGLGKLLEMYLPLFEEAGINFSDLMQ